MTLLDAHNTCFDWCPGVKGFEFRGRFETHQGPISVAVFGPNEEAAFATDAMISMQDCWPEIRQRVTFHLVYPTQHRADLSTSRGRLTYRSCDHLRAMIHDYGSDDSANYKVTF